jgi:Carboxypeptidase regulatory-like domain
MRKYFRALLPTLVLVLNLVIVVSISRAQTSKGTIVGTVVDATGAAVVGANITAQDRIGGEKRATSSGSFGEYRITAVFPGIYQVMVTAPGFATLVVDRIQVAACAVTMLLLD